MKRPICGLALLMLPSTAAAASQTDFGIRVPPPDDSRILLTTPAPAAPAGVTWGSTNTSLSTAVAIASRLGRVTSTRRSPAHNRAVGGVRNSYHLIGRAIDVVPRAGVRHTDIETELRNAGFYLLESLDEGDHSHFAFDTGRVAPSFRSAAAPRREVTRWRIVSVPGTN